MDNSELQKLHDMLVRAIEKRGYPRELGELIAANLGTEKTMSRMLGYLWNANPRSAEEIVDEMIAIRDDRDRWVKKKQAEYANQKYNELLYYGLTNAADDDDET